jgi:hypothetical protein
LASDIEENLTYAAHCVTMAERARDAEEHEEWSRLARRWLKSALDHAEAEFRTETRYSASVLPTALILDP